MNLIEWTRIYIKNRDSFERDIINLEEKGNKIIVNKNSGQIVYSILKNLSEIDFNTIEKGKQSLVCPNQKLNITFLMKQWKEFIKNPELKIIFVNIEYNEKWILCPYTHDRITDEKALKPGLMSLYNSIQETK